MPGNFILKMPFSWPQTVNKQCLALAFAAVACAAIVLPASAQTPAKDSWIPTWSASPQPVWDADFFAPVNIPRALVNQTIRQVARVSLGGHKVRILFSNLYGKTPLTIGAAHVALAGEGPAVVAGTGKALTFGGQASVTIPPGAPALSDPADLDIPALGSVAVSAFFPDISPTTTWHNDARQTAYISEPGNVSADATFTPAKTVTSRLFLSEILVDAAPADRAVVLFGDSITDGDGSTIDANHRWPDFLAERLHKLNAPIAVVNQGISGDRVLSDRMGDNALARFDRDVLSQPHVDTIVFMMGINDIGWPGCILTPKNEAAPSVEDIIAGYKQLIARAHDHGLRIIGATLTPFEDTFHGTPIFGYYNEEKEAKREAVNAFIRSGAFDGVIDFDKTVRDPANPKHILAEYDHGDHLHPNDTGYKAMADSIGLSLLGVNEKHASQ